MDLKLLKPNTKVMFATEEKTEVVTLKSVPYRVGKEPWRCYTMEGESIFIEGIIKIIK
jgi:hypothetical protein